MADTETKKQHYVPQFYLRRFTDEDGKLHPLDLKNKRLSNPKPTSGIGYKHYYYAGRTGEPDEVSQQVESWLNQFEDAIAKELPVIIKKIVDYQYLDDTDKYILSVFMSLMWLRSPAMREQIQSYEKQAAKVMINWFDRETINKYLKDTGKVMTEKEKDDLLEFMRSDNWDLRVSNAQHLKFMTTHLGFGGPGFANMFYGMKWKIYIAKGNEQFITSDSPIVEWWLPPKTFYGPTFLDRNKYFALTPEILIQLTYPMGSTKIKREALFSAQDKVVRLFNILIASHAIEFAYGSNREVMQKMLDGSLHPGLLEREYYEKYEKPWSDARRQGRA